MLLRALIIAVLLVIGIILIAKATGKQKFVIFKILTLLAATGFVAYVMIYTIYHTTQGSIL